MRVCANIGLGAWVLVLAMTACRREERFPALGDKVASPVDVEKSQDGSVFYVLNADFDRTYNQGSVLVIDKNGDKLAALPVPRMGRNLVASGSDMLATFDAQDDDHGPMLVLFDVKDPRAPVEVSRQPFPCSPLGTELRAGYSAITCTNGELYLAKLQDDRGATRWKRVRSFGVPRRALYIDPVRQVLLGFTTDLDKQSLTDIAERDIATYDETGRLVGGSSEAPKPDEIPDERQNNRRGLSNRGAWQTYQFFVYDLAGEANPSDCTPSPSEDCVYPYRSPSQPKAKQELRWIYFKLLNFDGTPDPMDPAKTGSDYKYYRTNFWAARPDSEDPDVFYLSHRGPPRDNGSPHANQIVRVRIIGDLLGATRSDSTAVPPSTDSLLQFERVYGFNGLENSKFHYPSDFEIAEVAGQKVLLVNHFRDLVNWVRGDTYFSVAAKVLDDNTWITETTNAQDPGNYSWYQTAMTRDGMAMSCLFYSNAVMLLEVVPGVGIREVKRIQ